MNIQNPIVRSGALKTIALDSLENMFGVIRLFMNIYLIDYILHAPEKDLIVQDKTASLCWLNAAHVVPFMMFFSWINRNSVGGCQALPARPCNLA